ncbi:MAG: transglycosylase SLT domain-containing protein [Chitinispirillales bacterium]|nr:transglycosylase SLT domain-containing protein [Chitinispirillales bacterium]
MRIDNFNIDYNAARGLEAKGSTARGSKAAQVAKEFEAMFTSMMFKAMRGTVNESSLIRKNIGENIFTEMLDGEYAKMSSENGALGLAALIQKEIDRCEGRSPALDGSSTSAAMRRSRASWAYAPADSAALIEKVRGKWDSLISEVCERYGVDKDLVTAVVARESAGNPHAISPKGAKGLMQLMDATARDMGVGSSFSPIENITGGVKYLKNMLNSFNGDESLALASYNAGPGAVKRYNGIPPYRETREYVRAVLALKAKAAEGALAAAGNENNAVNAVNAESGAI